MMCSIFSRIKMAKDMVSPLYYGGVKKLHLTREKQNYENAVKKLNSLQSNASVLQLAKKAGRNNHLELAANVDSTVKYLKRTGISLDRLDKLPVIHVSGTKGKGTTCALCESILRHHGYRTGFFSSPHLVAAKERIRINGAPLTHQKFADYFEEVFAGIFNQREKDDDMPPYFKFMTVMAFNVFIKEQVDVAIIEVGIGGEYDCTNCISFLNSKLGANVVTAAGIISGSNPKMISIGKDENPAVVGITSLGLDHTYLLGDTLPEIAWQKAGIMKPGTVAFTVIQKSQAAMEVLKERAENRKCDLYICPPLDSYLWDTSIHMIKHVDEIQSLNISLALQLATEWMKLQSPFFQREVIEKKNIDDGQSSVRVAKPFQVTKKMADGLTNCSWPGRTQIIVRNNITYFLDGAHTEESIKYCSNWFRKCSKILQERNASNYITRILIFNTTGQRSSERFMEILSAHNFDMALFTTNIEYLNMDDTSDVYNNNVTNEEQYERAESNLRTWNKLNNGTGEENSRVFQTVSAALSYIHENVAIESQKCHILITGSLHLVGNSLRILDPELTEPVHHMPADLKPLQNIYNGIQAIL